MAWFVAGALGFAIGYVAACAAVRAEVAALLEQKAANGLRLAWRGKLYRIERSEVTQ